MKKILFFCVLSVFCALGVMAQGEQFVSTEVSNKNVVLEEYTGVNCTYCPDGHRIANQIVAANPDRVFVINVHAGYYANNTYTTTHGNTLQSTFSVSSFPAGTINRHSFSGSLVLSRSSWSTSANTILNQTSPVNIAARGTLDWTTRELDITVQLYYTSNEANATNKLNVAILQDNVIGSQVGASSNPSQVVGSQYRHMHMFRGYLPETGQWGDEITTTTAGSFVERHYTYTIPASLGSPTAVQAKLEDLHFVAFVAQGQQEILTGCEVEIENVNMPALNPRLDNITMNEEALNSCELENSVFANVSNIGSDAITSLTFEYNVANGPAQTYTWTGNIASTATEAIELPAFSITPNVNQVVKAHITAANGEPFNGFEVSGTTKKNAVTANSSVTLKVKGDDYSGAYTYQGSTYQGEQSFKLYGPNNNVIQSATYTSFTCNAISEFPLNITSPGCYRLEVYDAYGDGFAGGWARIYDAANTMLCSVAGNTITDKAIITITAGEGVSIDDVTADENMTIYPNPTTDAVNIITGLAIQQVEVYNLQGQRVAAEMGNVNSISLNGLANGLYIMKVTTDQGISTYKVSKK